jgi:hypothetical protein
MSASARNAATSPLSLLGTQQSSLITNLLPVPAPWHRICLNPVPLPPDQPWINMRPLLLSTASLTLCGCSAHTSSAPPAPPLQPVVACLGLVAGAIPALAHHAFAAEYDGDAVSMAGRAIGFV